MAEPMVLEGAWRDVARQAEALAPEQRVRLELLAGGEEQSTARPNQLMLNAMREAEEVQRGMNPAPPPGLDAVSLVREARAGATWSGMTLPSSLPSESGP